MSDERFLGKILSYDVHSQVLTIKVDFLDPDKLQTLQEIYEEKKVFSFWFKKPFKRSKTYEQLKKYHALLNQILKSMDIFPDKEIVTAFDEEIKKSALSCKEMVVCDKVLPLIPSKADMSIEELSTLIQFLISNYGPLLETEEILPMEDQ